MRISSGQFAEDLLAATKRLPEHADAFQAPEVDPRVDGVADDQVLDGDGFALLAATVDTADALLDTHGVPGQVVVDEGVAELVVEALGAHLG